MCNFECSNCEEQEKCKELRPWDFEESEEASDEVKISTI